MKRSDWRTVTPYMLYCCLVFNAGNVLFGMLVQGNTRSKSSFLLTKCTETSHHLARSKLFPASCANSESCKRAPASMDSPRAEEVL